MAPISERYFENKSEFIGPHSAGLPIGQNRICNTERNTLQFANGIMNEKPLKTRNFGAALRFLEVMLASGRVAFSLDEFLADSGLSAIAARNQLLRLGHRVVRVSRVHQFFLIVSPEHTVIGAPPVNWWMDDYFKWLNHPYYLTLQSAAAAYGSTPQAVQVSQIMTDKPRRPVSVGRLRIHFFVKREIRQTPTQPMANAYAPIQVSTPEATAFDLIRYASRIGGIGRAWETLKPLLPLLRISEMKKVLVAEGETATAQRLGFLLERTGNTKLAEVIRAWLPRRPPLIPLVSTTSQPTDAAVVESWRLMNNLSEREI